MKRAQDWMGSQVSCEFYQAYKTLMAVHMPFRVHASYIFIFNIYPHKHVNVYIIYLYMQLKGRQHFQTHHRGHTHHDAEARKKGKRREGMYGSIILIGKIVKHFYKIPKTP